MERDILIMNNSILIVGHTALPQVHCNEIIRMIDEAPFTELESKDVDHMGHIVAENDADEDRLKYEEDDGRICYTLGPSNPDTQKVMEWVEGYIPWDDDFAQVSYIQILKYPMEAYMAFHKDKADSGDTGTVIFNLNDDFTGGNLTIDGHKLLPFQGTMVAFNNSTERWHGVEPVLTGERYVLSLWFNAGTTDDYDQESMTQYDTSTSASNDDDNIRVFPKVILKN